MRVKSLLFEHQRIRSNTQFNYSIPPLKIRVARVKIIPIVKTPTCTDATRGLLVEDENEHVKGHSWNMPVPTMFQCEGDIIVIALFCFAIKDHTKKANVMEHIFLLD